MSRMQMIKRHPIRIALFGVFVIAIILFRLFDVGAWLNIETLQSYEQTLRSYIQAYYWSSVAIFIIAYAIEAALSLPISFILSIGAGFFYGTYPAVLYILLGATLGAVGACVITRYLFGSLFQRAYRDKLRRFNAYMQENGAYYIIILRLIPIVPFFLINILVGLTNISLLTFALTTAIGILPGAWLYAAAGDQLQQIHTIGDIFTWDVIFMLTLIILFITLPLIIKRWYGWRPLE